MQFCPVSGKVSLIVTTNFKALYPEIAAEYSSNNEVSSDTILSTYSPLVEWERSYIIRVMFGGLMNVEFLCYESEKEKEIVLSKEEKEVLFLL